MHKISTCITLVFLSYTSFSQSNAVASGGDATGSGGSVSYTIGQIDYINSSGTNGTIHQGVQQPFEFFRELGLNESELVNLSLYPNPTNEFLVIKLETFLADLNYELHDMNGKIVVQGIINNLETKLDVRSFAPGEYHLSITNNNNRIQSIKIIKH